MDKTFHEAPLGVKIVRCCASCKHKQLDGGTSRICMIGEGVVNSSCVCDDWEMSKDLIKAGLGSGRVKKKSYLMYVLKRYEEVAKITDKNKKVDVHINDLRKEYNKKFGSIYINE